MGVSQGGCRRVQATPVTSRHQNHASRIRTRPAHAYYEQVPQLTLRSGCLVLLDLRIDFVSMSAYIRPCVSQIFRAQLRIGPKYLRIRCPKPPSVLEKPYRDAGPDDARGAAADARHSIDPGVRIADILRYPSKQLGLLSPRHGCQQSVDLKGVLHTTIIVP